MNRREALQQVAFLMGGTLSACAILGIEKGYCADTSPGFFNASQKQVVSKVADVMIPRTDTPGALDVGVPGFIDLMLRDVYAQADRDRYLAGLAEFEAAARSEGESGYAAVVKKFHDAAVAEERRRPRGGNDHPHRPFILMTKELTLLGFFTSQVGATQVLQYAAVPGSFHACIPLARAGNGKSWAFEPGIEF